jgi:hypothetical protein
MFWFYFFFGPLFCIGGLGTSLALLPPFLDMCPPLVESQFSGVFSFTDGSQCSVKPPLTPAAVRKVKHSLRQPHCKSAVDDEHW